MLKTKYVDDKLKILVIMGAGLQMPTIKNIERQMISVGDPIAIFLQYFSRDMRPLFHSLGLSIGLAEWSSPFFE